MVHGKYCRKRLWLSEHIFHSRALSSGGISSTISALFYHIRTLLQHCSFHETIAQNLLDRYLQCNGQILGNATLIANGWTCSCIRSVQAHHSIASVNTKRKHTISRAFQKDPILFKEYLCQTGALNRKGNQNEVGSSAIRIYLLLGFQWSNFSHIDDGWNFEFYPDRN